MDYGFGAVAIEGEPTYEIAFSFCSLVTKPHQYSEMLSSFNAVGFDATNSEFLYIDNTKGNSESAFAGLNRLARFARGEYLVFCHQDVVAMDGPDVLRAALADLSARDPLWAVAANAGCAGKQRHYYLNEPNNIGLGPQRRPAMQVTTIDENLIILKREAQLGFSVDLNGFHLYGTDLVTQAATRGRSTYIIDFRVEHTSSGTVNEDFYSACLDFEEKYSKAFEARPVTTTCTTLDIGTNDGPARKNRLKNLARGPDFERPTAKLRKALRGWVSGYSIELDGHSLHYPKDISVADLQDLRKGRVGKEWQNLISNQLPKNLPNIVLGAGYGLISGLAHRKLSNSARQIIVEQNSDYIELCKKNSRDDNRENGTLVLNRRVSYQQFSAENAPSQKHRTPVAETTLGLLLSEVDVDGAFSLICNIGGTELDMLEYDTDALENCHTLLATLNPGSYYKRNTRVKDVLAKLDQLGLEIVEVQGNQVAAIRRFD